MTYSNAESLKKHDVLIRVSLRPFAAELFAENLVFFRLFAQNAHFPVTKFDEILFGSTYLADQQKSRVSSF